MKTSRQARGLAKGTWKKERATRRKFTANDEHPAPQAHSRKKYWVGNYSRGGQKIKGHFRTNPNFKKSASRD